MKLLQIYKDFYPPICGGIEGHINALSKGLIQSGIDVEVLVSNTSTRLERELSDGVKVIKAPEFGRFASAPINPTLPILINKLSDNADILHFHLPNPTAVGAYALSGIKKPIVVTYHSDIVRQAKLKKIYWPIQKAFLKKADVIIATSPNYINTSKVLCKYKHKCHVIPLGVDTKRFKIVDNGKVCRALKQYGERTVLFVGKLRYYKGISVLIEAMRYVNGRIIIIGDGPLRKKIIKQIRSAHLEDKVVLVGEISEDKVRMFFNSCKVFVLPSIFRSEAFGIVLAEAMACGKPVISTELGTGTSFINLHKKTGLVVPPNNSKLLAGAINNLLDNPKINAQYGTMAKKRIIEGFTLEKMIKGTIDIYQKVYSNNYERSANILRTKNICVNNDI